MKVAFIVTQYHNPRASGVLKQARNWKRSLEALGVTVELMDPWKAVDWRKDFDLIHIFSGSYWASHLVADLMREGIPVLHSPILDTAKNLLLYRLTSFAPLFGHKLYTMPAVQKRYGKLCTYTLARSRDEFNILHRGIGLPASKIRFIPIGMRPSVEPEVAVDLGALRNKRWCLHVSQYTQDRKNLVRLAAACGRANISLVVCGDAGSERLKEEIKNKIGGRADCLFLDFVPASNLTWLYRNCHVFALPSLYEGVGLSALEAAYYGSPVVASKIGGTRDYLKEYAFYADPYSEDEILEAIHNALNATRNEGMALYIKENFTDVAVADNLLNLYRDAVAD